jgi:pSer/pThr/pTyr-binding forkhead associated (FHA) protein/uncharacterized RDD family membrane protein YckC
MAKLNFMDRENLLREYEISGDMTSIGREANNTIVIADPSVSRSHAIVEKKEDGYYLVDKNSSNGTFINGKKVTGTNKLSHQDKINLGNASMVFEDEEQLLATFILPRSEMPISDSTRAETRRDEEPTDSIDLSPPMPATPSQPPPPSKSPAPPRVEPPAPAAAPAPPARPVPPPPAPSPAAPSPSPPMSSVPRPEPSPTLCSSCKKPVEAGARFCGFCGTPLAPSKPSTPPPPPKPTPPPLSSSMKPAEALKPPVPPPPPKSSVPPPVQAAPRRPAGIPATAGLNYAGFAVRLVAYLIDALILGLLLLLPLALIFFLTMRSPENPSPFTYLIILACSIIMFVISVGYQLYFVGAKGATPGKKIMKLKVTLADGTFPIGYGKAFLRMIGYMVSGAICYIGFLMIAFDKEQHRGLHDKIAGTVVIKES